MHKIMKRNTKKNIAAISKILLGFCYVLPIMIGILFSFHPNREIGMAPLKFFTDNPTIQNYIDVWKTVPILTYLKNTLIVVAISLPVQLLFASISAFAFTFYEFPGREFLFTLNLTAMMIPGEVTMIANYSTIQRLGMYNTYLGIVITGLSGVGAMFMLRQHMKSLPLELWEAARMDGCRPLNYFAKVVMPLSTPILAAQGITGFIGSYNSYLWPLMVTSTIEMRTIQVGMAQLMSDNSVGYGIVLAGAVLCMVIPILMYVFGQEKIVKGLTAGAVKS